MQKKKFDRLKVENGKPNLRAPRFGKEEFTHLLVTRKLYEKWKRNNPEYKDVTWQEYRRIWKSICRVLWDTVMNNPDEVRLPFYTGEVTIKYVYSYNPPLDGRNKTEDGEMLEFLNWNTNGKLGKIVWNIEFGRKYNKQIRNWAFTAHQKERKRVALLFKQLPETYKDTRATKINLPLNRT